MKVTKYGLCQKCNTDHVELFEYNGRLICKANECLQEEFERDSGKDITDEEELDVYRQLVAGTKGVDVT